MKRRTILVSLILIVVSLFFFYPIFEGKIPFPGDLLVGNYSPYRENSYAGFQPGGVPHKAQGPDVVRQLFPWKHLAIESYREGQIPLWNPYNLSGNPLMANFQSGVFYPLNVVFLPNFLTGWALFVLSIPILASFFTYIFLRELNVGRKASIFGAISFAFSSYMTVWMEYGNVGHTFLWLPLALFFTERLSKNFSIKTAIFLIASLTASFLAGYIQGYFYIVLTLMFYFFIKSKYLKTFRLKKFLLFLLFLLYPILLSAFQFVPTLELFTLSSRNNYTLSQIDKLLNPVWYTITTIVPNFFGHPASRNHWFYGTYIERVSYFGFIPFVFAIYALFNIKKRKELLIFGGLFLGSLFLATNLFITKFIYLFPLPIISTTVPTRILSLFVFGGSILASFGLDLYLQKNNHKLSGILKIIAAIFVLMWGGVIGILEFSKNPQWLSNIAVTKNNIILPTLFLISLASLIFINFLLNKRYKKAISNIVILGIFILTLFDLFYFFHKITPFSPKEYIYPPTDVFEYLKKDASIYRSWGYGSGSLENNFQTYEKIFSTDGYEPLHSKIYSELISASKNGAIESRIAGSDANIAGGWGEDDLKNNFSRQRIMNITGVKYVLNKTTDSTSFTKPDYKTFPDSIYKLIWQKGEWQIYENKQVLPRIFLADNFIVVSDKKKIIKTLLDSNFDPKKTLVLEEDIPNFKIGDKRGKVEIVNYAGNNILLRTNAENNTLLFVSDNYFPGWKASVDGNTSKIYKANYAFRAVPVPAGQHEVKFSYSPKSFTIGLVISMISFLSMLIFILTFLIRRKRSRHAEK